MSGEQDPHATQACSHMKTESANGSKAGPRCGLLLGVLILVAVTALALKYMGAVDPHASSTSANLSNPARLFGAVAEQGGTRSADSNAACDTRGGAGVNPFGSSASPNACTNRFGPSDRTKDAAVPWSNHDLELEKATQAVLGQVTRSRNKIEQIVQILDKGFECGQGVSPSQAEHCIPVLNAQQGLINDLVRAASSGNTRAKFELARLLFKEQVFKQGFGPQILSSMDSQLSKDSDEWHARALQLLKEAASQGQPEAIEQLERIASGEGFLVD